MEKLGKKLKHDHTLTSILKFAIFSVIMLAPIFSVASRCLYVICNKNAKDSYSGKFEIKYKYETNEITTNDDLVQGNIYNLTLNEMSSTNGNYVMTAYAIYNVQQRSFYYTSSETDNLHYFQIEMRTDGFAVRDNNYNQLLYVNLSSSDYPYTFNVVFRDTSSSSLISYAESTYNIIDADNIDQSGTLDNAFEYSLSQLEESNYYNWATNLGIYTPIYNMVHGLGGHDIIALLLAYWSIYTAIYIVFDIVIACFVKITHLLQSE